MKGLDEVGQIFMAAPDAGVKKIIAGDAIFVFGLIDEICRDVFFEIFVDAFVDDFNFFRGDFENFFNILFSIFGYGNDFFGLADGTIDDEVIGKAVERRGHFFARIKRKGEIMDGDN